MTTVYVSENFDGVTPPALPSGWSSAGATIATSASVSYSGANSLKFSVGQSDWSTAGKYGTLDSNYGNVWVEAKFSPVSVSVGGGRQMLGLFARATSAPSGNTLPGNAFTFAGPMLNGATYWELAHTDGSGTYTVLWSNTHAPGFTAGAWYRAILTVQDAPNRTMFLVSSYIQRMSDGAWLLPNGNWSVGDVMAPYMSILQTYTFLYGGGTYSYQSAWGTGSFAGIITNLISTETMYVDDFIYQSIPDPVGVQPSSPPAAGNEVELIPSAVSASDSGQSGHTSANVNVADSDFTSYYGSELTTLGGFGQYIYLDAGSGVTATPTAALWSTAAASFFGGDGTELYMTFAAIEGANSTSGPWTALGAPPNNQYPEPRQLTTIRLDPSSPGGTFRYFRLRALYMACVVNQFRMLVQNSGGVSWRPARPIFSPKAGRYAAGQTVTITSQTSGASIYYTVGTRTSPPADPTTASTLYSAPVTIASNAPDETIIKAIAHHASGTTQDSAVETAHFIVGTTAEFVSDTGVSGSTWFSNGSSALWPSDWYDDRGSLLQSNNADCFYDTATSLYWLVGGNMNMGRVLTATNGNVYYRGHNWYSSSDLLNWTFRGQLVMNYPAPWGALTAGVLVERLHILVNPNPSDSNKKYVGWAGANGSNATYAICFTAPAMVGPWTARGIHQTPTGLITDDNVFYDDVDDGTGSGRNKAYYVSSSNGTNVYATQLDPALDWTDFTGSVIGLAAAGTNSWQATIEAPQLFKFGGYYFVVCSKNAAYGFGDTAEQYASATTLAGLGSATSASIWAVAPGSNTVKKNAQGTHFLILHGRVDPCFIFMADQQDADDTANPPVMYNWRMAWWPASTTAGGNKVNAFPSAGVLSLAAPTAWDMSYLPDAAPSTAVARSLFRRANLTLGGGGSFFSNPLT